MANSYDKFYTAGFNARLTGAGLIAKVNNLVPVNLLPVYASENYMMPDSIFNSPDSKNFEFCFKCSAVRLHEGDVLFINNQKWKIMEEPLYDESFPLCLIKTVRQT